MKNLSKKVFGIFCASMLMMSMANSSNNFEKKENCLDLFDGVYDAYNAVYNDSGYAWQAATWAYEGCVGNGGDAGGDSVVFIGN